MTAPTPDIAVLRELQARVREATGWAPHPLNGALNARN